MKWTSQKGLKIGQVTYLTFTANLASASLDSKNSLFLEAWPCKSVPIVHFICSPHFQALPESLKIRTQALYYHLT